VDSPRISFFHPAALQIRLIPGLFQVIWDGCPTHLSKVIKACIEDAGDNLYNNPYLTRKPDLVSPAFQNTELHLLQGQPVSREFAEIISIKLGQYRRIT
jgi:hypothetical protein